MTVSKTSVAVDLSLLDAAKEALGTRTMRETIDMALREVLRARARKQEVAALRALDGLGLADPEIMKGAWRP